MAAESHILDGLVFTNGNIRIAEPPTFTPAPVRVDWVGGVDSDGTIPVDAGRSDNSVLTIPLRVAQTATADLAWQQIGLIVAKLDQTRRTSGGLTHLWTPKDATSTWELQVRSGEIVEFPMDDRGNLLGYLKRFPRITVVLYCAPFLKKQGEVVDFTEVTSTEPVFSISLPGVPGHVDAEATVTVTDNASQARRHVECGMGPTSAAPLFVESSSLVIGTGYTGVVTSGLGATYYAGTTISGAFSNQVQALCGTGNLTHVGAHKIKARVLASHTSATSAPRVRLAYRTGDTDYAYTPWETIINLTWAEVDFGVLNIPVVGGGAQQWDGRIEYYDSAVPYTGSGQFSIDYMLVLPAERAWKFAVPNLYRAGLLAVSDSFVGLAPAAVLNARVSGAHTWTTSGATTDFVGAAAPLSTDTTVSRATTNDAFLTHLGRAGVGATSYPSVEVGVSIYRTVQFSNATGARYRQGVIARWTDSNNYVTAHVHQSAAESGGSRFLVVHMLAGGTMTLLATSSKIQYWIPGEWIKIRFVVLPSGTFSAVLVNSAGTQYASVQGQHSTLATGGSLATGKAGIMDLVESFPANTRYWDDFYISIPPVEPLAINSGRAIEFRHDSAYRTSSDGLTRGLVNPRGSRAFVPPAGPEARTTRLWAKTWRNNVDIAAANYFADSTKLDVQLRPLYRMPTYP